MSSMLIVASATKKEKAIKKLNHIYTSCHLSLPTFLQITCVRSRDTWVCRLCDVTTRASSSALLG